MPSLDDHGKLGAAVIPFYLPILVIAFILVLRHGISPNSGWAYLLIFSIARILGGALLVAAELVRPVNTNLYIGAFILQSAGLSPLLLATLGFIRAIGTNAFRGNGMVTLGFRLLWLLGTAALVLSIYGGSTSTSTNQNTLKTSNDLRHAGSILFAVLFGFLVAVHIVCWLNVNKLMKHHRTLLSGISAALPFLAVRVAYAVISSYSGAAFFSTTISTNSLARFNLINGEWWIYLIMALLMEYIVVVIYTTVGAMTPLQKDYNPDVVAYDNDAYPLAKQHAYSSQSHGTYVPPYQV